MIKHITINTASGRINPISLKDFVKSIPIKEDRTNKSDYLTHYRYPRVTLFEDCIPGPTKVLVKVLPPYGVSSMDILKHQTVFEANKQPIVEMIHDICTDSAYNMGDPTHVVRLLILVILRLF